jgi:hypothetical protein
MMFIVEASLTTLTYDCHSRSSFTIVNVFIIQATDLFVSLSNKKKDSTTRHQDIQHNNVQFNNTQHNNKKIQH